jgi:hypothetical protein
MGTDKNVCATRCIGFAADNNSFEFPGTARNEILWLHQFLLKRGEVMIGGHAGKPIVLRAGAAALFLASLLCIVILTHTKAYSVPGNGDGTFTCNANCPCRNSCETYWSPDGKGGGVELCGYRRPPGDTTAIVSSAQTSIVTNTGNICGSVATTSNAAGNPTYDEWKVNGANYICGPPSPNVLSKAELTSATNVQLIVVRSNIIVQVCN